MRELHRREAPDYSAVEQTDFASQQEALHFLKPRRKRFATLSEEGEQGRRVGGGRRDEEMEGWGVEKIQFHS